jgi:hypothetical protein
MNMPLGAVTVDWQLSEVSYTLYTLTPAPLWETHTPDVLALYTVAGRGDAPGAVDEGVGGMAPVLGTPK